MPTKFKGLFVSFAFLCCVTVSAQNQLAFPGAAGWGRFAQGARKSSAPTVYHVTNLNDSGTGSLRDAVSQGNRIVVFDVSGVIKISSRIVFSGNSYIAGQTAPGEGVTVYGDGVSFSGADHLICRYMRFRMGHSGTSGKDCAGIANGQNMIFDHCSFSWGQDENFSINPDGKGSQPMYITLQNNIIGQGLMTHSAGGLMQSDSITLYRNLYIDNSTRNNKVKGTNQYANNIVYNWKNGCYIMGGDSEGSSYCNITSNLFINGPAQGGNALGGGNSDFHFYGNDNWQDKDEDGTFNPSCIDDTQTGGGDKVATPYNYPKLELYSAKELIEKNIPTVGASLPYRDQSDCYMIDELMSYGKQGNLISLETSLPIGAPDTWAWYQGIKKTDTDGDGMPDAWESANGTDPSKADATVKATNGYLNIENYINSITVDDRDAFLRAPITLTLEKSTTSTLTLSWRDYTYAEEGFAIEMQTAGQWKEVARTAANATSYTIEGLAEATPYNVRVRAFGKNRADVNNDGSVNILDVNTVVNVLCGGTAGGNADVNRDGVVNFKDADAVISTIFGGKDTEDYSEYATGKFTTRQTEVGIIDIDSYQPNVTLGENQTVWNTTTTEWKEGVAFKNDDKVLLNTTADKTVSIEGDVYPQSVVANGTGHLTMEGTIMGSASVNHANTGTLTMSELNTYTGATVNHEGTVEFSKIADGGQASSLGASIADAQNWIMDGGTFKYTGATASSNRGARLLRESALNIANSSTTLAINGKFEGAGNLILDGPGTMSIADATTFGNHSGNVVINNGMLYLSDVEKACKVLSASVPKIVMGGGHLKFNTNAQSAEDYQTCTTAIEVSENTVSQITLPNHGYFKGALSGSGTIQFNVPYLRSQINSSFANFTGEFIANGTNSSGNSLIYNGGTWSLPNTRVTLKGKAKFGAWETNANNTLGGLSGDAGTYLIGSSKQTTNFQCSWTVGSSNSDETFNGIINNMSCDGKDRTSSSAKTSIVKVGTGIWRLTGANSYAGTTKVNAGTLIVNGKHTGTGAVTVANGATLRGEGTLAAPVTAANGSIIAAGDTIAYGKILTLNGAVTMQNGSTMQISLYNTTEKQGKCNQIAFGSTLNITSGSVLELDMSNVKKALEKNKYFTIFSKVPKSVTGEFTISPAAPGDSLEWDTSTLFTDGKLYIIKKGGQREEEKKDTSIVIPVGETKYAMVNYGNSTLGSYDNSSVNNMLTGGDNDESRGFKLVCTGNLTKALATGGTSPSKVTVTFNGETLLRTPVKMSNGTQETIFLPEDETLGKARATKITFVSIIPGYTTATAATAAEGYPRTSYWQEVAGTNFSLEQATADNKIIKAYNDQRSTPSVISFDLNNVEQITFTNAGEQQATIFIIEYHYGGKSGTGVKQ